VSNAGTIPLLLAVNKNDASVSAPGTYTETVTLSGATVTGSPFTVTFVVSPSISLSPGDLTFPTYTQGNVPSPPVPITETVTVNQGTANGYGFTTASNFGNGPTNWFTVAQTGGAPGSGSLSVATNVSVFPTVTTPTTYTGTVTVNSTGGAPGAAPVSFNVILTVNPQPTLTTDKSSLTFTGVNGWLTGIAGSQTVTLTTPTAGVQFNVNISYANLPAGASPWLTATPGSGNTNAATAVITTSIASSASTLPAGTYFATLAIVSPGALPANGILIPVTFTVNPEAILSVMGGPVTFAHTIIFTQTPATQTLNVTTTNGLAPATHATFTVTDVDNAGTPAGLLNLITTSGTTTGTSTPTPVQVSYSKAVADVTAPGTYGGTITVLVTGPGTTQTAPQSVAIPWSIVISPQPVIQTSPSSVSLTSVFNNTTVQSSTVTLNSTPGVAFTATVTSNGGNWLSVT